VLFALGGITDALGRVLAVSLGERLGQQVVGRESDMSVGVHKL
jgi:tripartite-type tricarboxylate transporter receptor subunit TctC